MNEDLESELYEQDDPFAFSDQYETMMAGDLYRFEDLNSKPDYPDCPCGCGGYLTPEHENMDIEQEMDTDFDMEFDLGGEA